MKAALFDVGDTLVEDWVPERSRALATVALRREFGEREWYERFLTADFGPNARSLTPRGAPDEELRQETLRWYEEWFRNSSIGMDDIDPERLRAAVVVPLDMVSALVRGAPEALRWCRAQGLRVVLVTNTLARGDDDVREDWRRFGLSDAIDGVVSSHSAGWQKPHRAIFERALQLAGARPDEAFMVGDRLDADILGAKRLGMRGVLRRTENAQRAVDVEPDATIGDLTELPAVVGPWLDVRAAHPSLSARGAADRP